MWTRVIATISLLVSTTAATAPRRFSVPARRLNANLHRCDGTEASASKDVVIDFTFGDQKIPLSLDTASTFTFVASTLDKNTIVTSELPALYNPNISSTYHDENIRKDAYNCGGDLVTCFMGVDNIATAGFVAEGMAFGVATHIEKHIFSSGQAAAMGFGRQPKDPSQWLPRDQTYWLRTAANFEMPYLFTVDIYQDRNATFNFGYIDTAKYTGEITYVPINTTQSNWNFQVNRYSIGNGSMQTVDTFTGVADSGGPNMGLPSSIVNPYFDSFGGSPSSGNSYEYPCSAYPPPNLTLYLESGGKLVINSTFLVQPPRSSRTTVCDGRVDNSVQAAYNIGASVLDQKFVVFDHANSRISFADKRRDGQPEGVAPNATVTNRQSSNVATATTRSAAQTSTSSSGASQILSVRSKKGFRSAFYSCLLYILYYSL